MLATRTVLLGIVLLGVVACAGEGGADGAGDPHAELRLLLDLPPDREIHLVTLGGHDAEEHVVPPRLRVSSDAVVVFNAVDGRVHTVAFVEDSLPLDAALFLRRTGQMSSPPLLDRGTRFVVSFADAPRGRYPFVSRGPGGEAPGALIVGEEPPPGP